MIEKQTVWNKMAKGYDKLWFGKYAFPPTRYEVLSRISKSLINGKRYLDIGCGTGLLVHDVAEINKDMTIVGIDKACDMISIAKDKTPQAEFYLVDICDDNLPLVLTETFDIITCTHSFPYHTKKISVLEKIHSICDENTQLIFIAASINNVYDKLVLSVVEANVEEADYMSVKAFRKIVNPYFYIVEEFTIKKHILMPNICGFVLKKKQ